MRYAASLALATLASGAFAQSSSLRDGDIIFQTSRSAQSVAVQKATGSRYSHMGLVLMRNGKPFVFEAAGVVQYTPLDRWVARGVGGHFVVKRLRDASEVLTSSGVERLHRASKKYQGRPYDLTFEWSDDRMYCSELIWKIYQRELGVRIGELQKIKEFDLTDPVVRKKMQERYGTQVPLEEPVISPVAMFESSRLVTVLEQ
jgi:uncharacterized protein YycO